MSEATGNPRNDHLYFFTLSLHGLLFKDLFQTQIGYIVILLNLLWVNNLQCREHDLNCTPDCNKEYKYHGDQIKSNYVLGF